MNIDNLLFKYKNVTLELINSISDIDKIEELIKQREQIIENINSISYEKSEFKKIAENLNLLELEEKLVNRMKKENVDTKKALENVRRLKKARSLYNKEDSRPAFFNMVSY